MIKEDVVTVSIKNGNTLRGIFAIVVVLHHLALRSAGGKIFRFIFSDAGMLAVGVFFFLSGYGLMKQYMARENYADRLLSKRLPSVIIPYTATTGFYLMISILWGEKYTVSERLSEIRIGKTILPHSWYMLAIIWYYIVFFILMKINGKHYQRLILMAFIINACTLVIFMALSFRNWWYNSGMMLSVGIFWAYYEASIIKLVKGRLWLGIAFGIATVAYFIVCRRLVYGDVKLPMGMPTLLQTFRVLFFLTTLLLISINFEISNPIMGFIGKYSFEIYLMQGFMLNGLRNEKLNIGNDTIYCILVLLGTIFIAIPVHYLYTKLIDAFIKTIG